jgi:hypothetical protein
MEEKKSREQIEKERTEYLDLKKEKEILEQDPTKRPAQRVSGWNSKLTPAKREIKRDRMAEKQTIVRQKSP